MNKAKLILTGVAFFALVGGAVAFNAQRFLPRNGVASYLTTRNLQPTILCTTANFVITDEGTPAITYTTILANNECPQLEATFTQAVD